MFFCAATFLVLPYCWAHDPVVSNVRARQLTDGTKRVEVLYDLSGAPAAGATVSVVFSDDGGASYTISPPGSELSGVGPGIRNGVNRRILWNAVDSLPAGAFGEQYRARVMATGTVNPGEEITITLPGGVTMDLVYIPAGTFMMGSPTDERGRHTNEDLHEVTLTQGYYLGKYEVTQGQWEAVMGSNPAHDYGVGDNYPVYYVSWNDICGFPTGSDCLAGSFIGLLNTHLGTSVFRMPTEAEWERAARGGTQTEFSFDTSGNPAWDTLCGSFPEAESYMVWCGKNNGRVEEVGSKLQNPYGLFDMHGNLVEWVADWYESSYQIPADPDPTGPASGALRVLRGGYWSGPSQSCRSATRFNLTSSNTGNIMGFRLARSE